MEKRRVLIVGGYGTVGRLVVEQLSGDQDLKLIIAGRNRIKAEETAQEFKASSCTLDANELPSVQEALINIDLVINCYGGPFTNAPLALAATAAERGIDYIDVSGSMEYSKRFLSLASTAEENHATLITGIGANPGIPSLAVCWLASQLEPPVEAEINFILGSNIETLSPASLQEMHYLFKNPPLHWQHQTWQFNKVSGKQQTFNPPFHKSVYLGPSFSYDMMSVTEAHDLNRLSAWSGCQSTFQGTLMYLGMKLGLAIHQRTRHLFLKLLKSAGQSATAVAESMIYVTASGNYQGLQAVKSVQCVGDEVFMTAAAVSTTARLLLDDTVSRTGAFLPPSVIPVDLFFDRLQALDCIKVTID